MISFKEPLILASKSPRRKHILELADIPNEVFVIDTEEQYDPSLPVEQIPIAIASGKLNAVKNQFSLEKRSLLAADTIVTIDGLIIGKPKDAETAFDTLKRLSGRTHKVITGVALHTPGEDYSFSETTLVTFKALTDAQIRYYIDKYAPFDKAGAYAIQEWIGAVGIEGIQGDFYNVMGLPVHKILPLLPLSGL